MWKATGCEALHDWSDMQVYLDCFPCFLRQTLDAVRFVTDDEEVHEGVLREVLELMCHTDARQVPPAIGQQIHRVIRQMTGNRDPYRQRKQDSNRMAMELYPRLRDRIRGSTHPLDTAVRLAVAGNVIDLGLYRSLDEREVMEAVDSALADGWDSSCLEEFSQAVNNAQEILYIGDNAGEIVFDRLLLEEMQHEKVMFAVKGSPVINDATMQDAETVGLTDLVEVIENGSNAPGTILEDCSAAFRDRFERSDLIIAKGQGNYESLSGIDKHMFFLLNVKCPVIARDLGCDIGQMILRRSHVAGRTIQRDRKEQTDARL
jgi:uncharacterized protein with ATP-grasp and redox domains